jgi:hypothetical protein
VALKLPSVVGVPVMAPVDVSSDRPGGSVPAEMLHVIIPGSDSQVASKSVVPPGL